MLLKAKGICKSYVRQRESTPGSNIFEAVSPTDIEISTGELIFITGGSGSGKTTLLNMLAGQLKPTCGEVCLDGEDIYALSEKALGRLRGRSFGYIPQMAVCLKSLTVWENVLLSLRIFPPEDEACGRRAVEMAEELLHKLEILPLKKEKVQSLSGGEKRRVCIARALVQKPDIIFADEPTGDLDERNTELVFEILKAQADSGAGVVIVTHESDIDKYGGRILKMNGSHLGDV